jgi:protein-disulfide isomerase
MKINKALLVVVAAVVIGAFVLGAQWYRSRDAAQDAAPQVGNELLVRPHSMTQGPANAPVTVVEFFDPECEACRAMYPIVKQVQSEFGDRMRLVIRYMPLHQNSAYAASLLEAARAQNRYWEYLEVVMARQPEWASHAAPRPDLLAGYAPQVGLDAEQLRVAATDPAIRSRIQQDQADGMALGANRTPTFFINGKMLPQLGYQQLRAAIQAELP